MSEDTKISSPTLPKQTHLVNVDQTSRNAFGIVYYGLVGNVVYEMGHHSKEVFETQRAMADKTFIGKWCYALIKTKDTKEAWSCAVVFPDGDIKVLQEGQVAISAPTTAGKWLDYNKVLNIISQNKILVPIRFAMDSRIPWKTGGVTLRNEIFTDEAALITWLKRIDPVRSILFVANPAKQNLAPDKEGLYILCTIVDA